MIKNLHALARRYFGPREGPRSKKVLLHRGIAVALTVVLVMSLAFSGTYAWVSISQIAYNEASGTPNPGGRIHDDYDGENKDVYAENFGSTPLFVRIKLTEYMELGPGAGLKSLNGGTTANPANMSTLVTAGTSIDSKQGWPVHIPGATVDTCPIGDPNNNVHKYVEWDMGGSKTYMPTFNLDLNDLSTDASGIAVDADNMAQTAVGKDDANDDHNDGTHDYWATGDTVVADETYWDAAANSGAGATAQKADVTHTAKSTLVPAAGGVITMAEWKTAGSVLGNFWVYDTDGWAYWANPLLPGQATSLLLDGINITEPDQDWYYCIDVEGQFATQIDIARFGENSESYTTDAQALLASAILSLEEQP